MSPRLAAARLGVSPSAVRLGMSKDLHHQEAGLKAGYQHVAVGVDFSDESEVAIRRAIDVAGLAGGKVSLLHLDPVPDDLPEVPEAMAATYHRYHELIAEEEAATKERMRALAEQWRGEARGAGAELEALVSHGFPDTGLCEVASEHGADLVAVGTHGRTGLGWFLLGSVARRVVRLAEQDVLVCRARGEGREGFPRILVPTDFSAAAGRALDAAAVLAAPGATIEVVHAVDELPPGRRLSSDRGALEQLSTVIGEAMRERGQQLIAGVKRDDLTVRFHVETGAPQAVAVEWAERDDFDLVAMGASGVRGARRLLLGSVAEATVQRAPCSVLVAHPPAAGDDTAA